MKQTNVPMVSQPIEISNILIIPKNENCFNDSSFFGEQLPTQIKI